MAGSFSLRRSVSFPPQPTTRAVMFIKIHTTVVISFPPAVGHTTLITLSGYAYGMKGFPIAAAGSLFGSAVTFIVLRLVFARRLRKWSESNEKWQALETVIVCHTVL